jgi:hypothetical protein
MLVGDDNVLLGSVATTFPRFSSANPNNANNIRPFYKMV